MLDGEIVCLGDDGRARFYDLMFNRVAPVFAAFDALWINGEDVRDEPLWQRKSMLEGLIKQPPKSVMYLQYIEGNGASLHKSMCELDVKGIVAKQKISQHRSVVSRTPWLKFKNPDYSQSEGRRELFNQQR